MALTLAQITYMASQLVPTAASPADMQDYLDLKQRELYRDFRTPIAVEQIDVANVPYYQLPDYIVPYRIKNVVVSGREYKYFQPEDQLCYYIYNTYESEGNSFLWIYPAPVDSSGAITVTFEDGPNTIDHTASSSTVPRFMPDYHELLVEALAEHLAALRKDAVLVNNHHAKYLEIYTKAMKKNRPKLKQYAGVRR